MLRDLFSLFPAYAGVIPEVTHNTDKKSAFPRIRGGDPKWQNPVLTCLNFSPHTRG